MTSDITKTVLQFFCIYCKGCIRFSSTNSRANDVYYPIAGRSSPELDCDRDVLPDLG